MKMSAICPDGLIARARTGTLSESEAALLDAHLLDCELCRISLQVGRDFDRELVARAGDDLLASRVAGKAVIAVKRTPWRWLVPVAASLVIALGSGAVAATMSPRFRRLLRAEASENHARELATPPDEAAPPSIAPAIVAPATVASHPSEPVPTKPRLVPKRSTRESASNEPHSDAQTLFASANTARRQNDAPLALQLYTELETLYPESAEAIVSQVSLGRMLLEQRHQPAFALTHFDNYLRQHSQAALEEEALFGRATALMQLGRSDEELATWRQILQRFPSSIYTDRARTRLEGHH
jgi:TolA-binding protein